MHVLDESDSNAYIRLEHVCVYERQRERVSLIRGTSASFYAET